MSNYHLGINMGHDRSVAIVQQGELKIVIEQERLDRLKHSVGFLHQSASDMQHMQLPTQAINYCLDALNISIDDVATITANMPGNDYAPDILRKHYSHTISDRIKTIPSHHLAHAFSAYWPSGLEHTIVLVADASGSIIEGQNGCKTESYSLYVGKNNQLTAIHSEQVQSHLAQLSTLGFVYEYISRKAGFVTRINDNLSFAEAGKLMGLSAYGSAQEQWETWFKCAEGSASITMSAYDIFLEVAALEKKYDDGAGKAHLRPWLIDLAYKVQTELEKVLCHLVSEAQKLTGLNKLCLAGGVALNSVANNIVLKRCALDDIFIFPAAADNGIAAGCAYWAYANAGGTIRKEITSATLGKSYSDREIDQALSQYQDAIVIEKFNHQEMVANVASSLAKGNIIARFEGGCEYGPRALGHRSIIADPTFSKMKDVVNARVKFREAFRPFAPFVPLERANQVFELETKSPFMLLVAKVREEYAIKLPAITHADGTGRVQTCTAQDNQFFYDICQSIENYRSGPPVLLNTSFNVAGQPIVETPEEAIATFLKTDIDYLALEDCWISKKGQPAKSYQSHIENLTLEPLPKGLAPNQSSVRPLMDELNSALFHGQKSSHWSDAQLKKLSQEGARYKETSQLYPKDCYISGLRTQLAPHVVLMLNPYQSSIVVDQTGLNKGVTLTELEVHLVQAMLQKGSQHREKLRLQFQLSPFELQHQSTLLQQKLECFSITFSADWLAPALEQDDEWHFDYTDQTLAAFASDDFNSRHSLGLLQQIMSELSYNEESITLRLNIESLQQIEPTHLHYYAQFVLDNSALSHLIRLFLLRASLELDEIRSILGNVLVSRLKALGILREQDDKVSAAVDIFCCSGLLFATDHRYMILEGDVLDEDPVMYIGMDSHGLVQSAPRNACAKLLDLCCGSGVQGLAATRFASQVTAVDLNKRAVRFSRFNAQLNNIRNYKVIQGNLYDVVENQTFDIILANPPFVPSPESHLKFRDGGSDGEAILREIIQRADQFLSERGELFIVTDLVDLTHYNEKLSSWWQGSHIETLVLATADRDESLFSVPHCHAPFGQSYQAYNNALTKWVENYRAANLKNVNFGYILIRKQTDTHTSHVTQRTIHNPSSQMFQQVNQWYTQRVLWHDKLNNNCYLSLHPDIKIRTQYSFATNNLPSEDIQYELFTEDNNFFTTYHISQNIFSELSHIAKTQPRLAQYLMADDISWIESLHKKGILQLSLQKQVPNKEVINTVSVNDYEIEELATKTTPTCLSSYLS